MKFKEGDHVLFNAEQVRGLGITGTLYKKEEDVNSTYWCVKLDDPERLVKMEKAGLTDWTPHYCNYVFEERIGLYGRENDLVKIETKSRVTVYQDRLKLLLKKNINMQKSIRKE